MILSCSGDFNLVYEIKCIDHVIKTHGCESRGQEEAGRMQRTSELFTGSIAVDFVNALNKPLLAIT